MCLHQMENHEPVEFGELGIDPVERDQVTSFTPLHIFPAFTYVQEKILTGTLRRQPKHLVHHRYPSILMTLPD